LTTVAGRSLRTDIRCREAGFETTPSLDDVVRRSSVVLSCVPPSEALAVARAVAARRVAHQPLLYIDLNSIAPRTVLQVEAWVATKGVDFADATIHGTAARLDDLAVLYASGPGASQVVELFGGVMRTEHLGDESGRAAAFKMLLGGVSKTLAATMLEVGCAAERLGLLPDFLQACRFFYPGWMEALDRTLASYGQHAARRAVEVAEAESLWVASGLRPCLTSATKELLSKLATDTAGVPGSSASASLEEFLKGVHAAGVCDAGGVGGERSASLAGQGVDRQVHAPDRDQATRSFV
jgi:3-hydroxyisobutyrate dehydrogenase-like beta-hydroxyacid dehydrogenase